jgi:ABC-2 type transport system permease protein
MNGKYTAMFRIYVKKTMAYRAELSMDMVFFMLSSFVYIFVWAAVYLFSKASAIHGITLTNMVVYLLVIGSISFLSWPGVANVLEEDMREGTIAAALIRPVRYIITVFMSQLPENLFFMAFGMIPILIAIYVLAGLHISAFGALAFAVEIAMAFLMINLIGFIIGSLSIYLTSIYGILNGIVTLFSILGGGIMPITLFPKFAYGILMLTPLPYLYFVPGGTFTGLLPPQSLPGVLGIGFAWIAVLAVIATLLWRKVSVDINSVGV